MAKNSSKKPRRLKKYYNLLIFLAVVILFGLFFIFSMQPAPIPEHSVYISSENVKQGDTVLVKVSKKYPSVSGSFNGQTINFFRKGKSDWSALLGIDADLAPSQYSIFVIASGEGMEKKINVSAADFNSANLAVTQSLKNKGFSGQIVIENIRKKDNPAINGIIEKFTPQAYFNGPFSFPLKNMQRSGYGFGEFIMGVGYQIQHLGIDLRASQDTEVFAVNDGKVVFAGDLSNYGKTIIIDHGVGIFSLYLHLDSFDVSLGQYVKNGQQIALSGETGYATAPHLHFSMRDSGMRINPVSFINQSQGVSVNYNLASIFDSAGKFFNIGQ